ncbi:unnamed protein product [Owenia fusiformis]|uniref:Aldose 1-epimerase n=1 Tax=Owenia fusiformis TaxID=6347 RepID=A0A8S4NN09_OWEFU|nr:unnamed protein product [Owenia fusiformis]
MSANQSSTEVTLSNNGPYGTMSDGRQVDSFTFKNKNGMEVTVLTLGGTIAQLLVPDNKGQFDDVTLGFDNLEGYAGPTNRFFGCIAGRYANRIGGGTFSIDGVTYNTPKNNGENTLHGGKEGFNKKVWDAKTDNNRLILSYVSADGEEGFPGQVTTHMTYQLTNDNEIIISYECTTTKPTPINLTNHSYFNLAIKDKVVPPIYDHKVCINAERYTPVNEALITTGELSLVEGTVFDLSTPTHLSLDRLDEVPGGGYDHNFCIRGPTGRRHAARIEHETTGRVLDVFTNQPGMQFYTGNFLGGFPGKSRANYSKHTGFCTEPQVFPDSPNKSNFPDSILRPGSTYKHEIVFKFSVTA